MLSIDLNEAFLLKSAATLFSKPLQALFASLDCFTFNCLSGSSTRPREKLLTVRDIMEPDHRRFRRYKSVYTPKNPHLHIICEQQPFSGFVFS